MFSLLQGFYEFWTRKPLFNIIILGLDNSGKTTLLERIKILYSKSQGNVLKLLAPIETTPTIGLNVGKIEIGGSQLQFWDLGGAEDLQSIWERYYSDSHGVLFVLDSSEPARIKSVQSVMNRVFSNSLIEGIPVAVAANKQDLTDQIIDIVRIKEAINPIMVNLDARESKVFPISAVTGDGIVPVLSWLLATIHQNIHNRPPS